MITEELRIILDKHKAWFDGNKDGERANLRWADLRGANLRVANLSEANLRLADLRGANLHEADLRGANLRVANLSEANLRLADLRGANLHGADLSEADLREADLRGADLRGANLSEADLRGARSGSVCRIDFGGWSICIREDKTSIGCKTHENAKWMEWTYESPEILAINTEASKWWKRYGPAVKAAIGAVVDAKAEIVKEECE